MSGKTNGNGNYEEREDGWYKKDQSVTKGNAGYFARPMPPVRVGGIPLRRNGGVLIWNYGKRRSRKNVHTITNRIMRTAHKYLFIGLVVMSILIDLFRK